MTFNIWNIRNRYARIAASWLLAATAAIVVLALLPLGLAWVVVAGIYGSIYGAWVEVTSRLRDPEWRDGILRPFWLAATGREVK